MDGWTLIDYVKVILICLLWYLSSAVVNITGKIILLGFPYPMTVAMVQLVTNSVALSPFLSCIGVKKKGSYTKRYFYTMILPLALGKFITSVLSFISIWRVSVSYVQTVKATLPLFTVGLTKLFFGEGQTLPVYLSLLAIIVGVGVTTVTEVSFDLMGLTSSLISTLCFCLITIFSKKCLKETGYHHIQLLIVMCRFATICILPIWAITDLPSILQLSQFSESGHTLLLLLGNTVASTLSNVFAFTILAVVSPVSYAVANATKRIVIIAGSILVLQNVVSPLNAVGMLFAVFGVLSYNKAKYEQMQASRRQKILPYIHSDSNLQHLGVSHIPHSKSDADFYAASSILTPSPGGAPLPPRLSVDPEQLVKNSEKSMFVVGVDGSFSTQPGKQDTASKEDYTDKLSSHLHSRGVHQL